MQVHLCFVTMPSALYPDFFEAARYWASIPAGRFGAGLGHATGLTLAFPLYEQGKAL
ncbi:MAG: hypothetical protein IH846_03950, partial [Acidobacteria bacterium]|nr:hypothetical protein [Acidobacteriota bacterium]